MLLEATPGFEPGIRVLQTRALPLGYIATYNYNIFYFCKLYDITFYIFWSR